MTRSEFDGLRSRYRAASDTHRLRAARIAKLTKDDGKPPESELRTEAAALWDLALIRQKLLDAIKDLSRPRQ